MLEGREEGVIALIVPRPQDLLEWLKLLRTHIIILLHELKEPPVELKAVWAQNPKAVFGLCFATDFTG